MEEYKFNKSEWEIIHNNNDTFSVKKRKENGKQWVRRMINIYQNDTVVNCAAAGKFVFVYDYSGNIAKARCATDDTFDSNTGVAIAYARLKGLPIHPDFVCEKKEKPTIKQEYAEGEHVRIKKTGEFAIIDTFYAFKNTYKVYEIRWNTTRIVKADEIERMRVEE